MKEEVFSLITKNISFKDHTLDFIIYKVRTLLNGKIEINQNSKKGFSVKIEYKFDNNIKKVIEYTEADLTLIEYYKNYQDAEFNKVFKTVIKKDLFDILNKIIEKDAQKIMVIETTIPV